MSVPTPPVRDEQALSATLQLVYTGTLVENECLRESLWFSIIQGSSNAHPYRVVQEALQAERTASLARLRAFCLNLDRTTGKFPESDYEGLAVYSKYVGDPRGLDEKIEEWEEEMSRL